MQRIVYAYRWISSDDTGVFQCKNILKTKNREKPTKPHGGSRDIPHMLHAHCNIKFETEESFASVTGFKSNYIISEVRMFRFPSNLYCICFLRLFLTCVKTKKKLNIRSMPIFTVVKYLLKIF